MQRMDIEEYIKTRVDDQLSYADRVASRHKKMYIQIEWILISIITGIPIIHLKRDHTCGRVLLYK